MSKLILIKLYTYISNKLVSNLKFMLFYQLFNFD